MVHLTAAVVQMCSGIGVDENIAAMDTLVTAAAGDGANYVQTPEMTGLVQQSRQAFFNTIVPQEADPVVQAAGSLAEKLGIYLHIGSTPVLVGAGKAANRAFLFGPDGRIAATYDKIHMFDVDLDNGESWRESAVYEPGSHGVIVDVGGMSFGLAICYDCRFPELHTTYARAGAEVLTAPSCFTRQTGRAHWHILLRSRAIENGAYMIAAAQGGNHQDGRETYGHSIIIDPWGTVIGEVDGDEPGYAIAEVDTHNVKAARSKVPNLVNNRSFALQRSTASKETAA